MSNKITLYLYKSNREERHMLTGSIIQLDFMGFRILNNRFVILNLFLKKSYREKGKFNYVRTRITANKIFTKNLEG